MKINLLLTALLFGVVHTIKSQTTEIKGLIKANASLENIHVINKIAQKFTTTNALGRFVIKVNLNDTLVFSSIQYKNKEVIITPEIISEKVLIITLLDDVTTLDEVVVGKVLTGDLLYDIKNSEVKRPLNFYDLGIPGYTGKQKTQSERLLFEADNGKYVSIFKEGLVKFNIIKILNKISGRTKMLKERVKVEAEEQLMIKIRNKLFEDFLSSYTLDEKLRIDFFYFCLEDENFSARCKGKNNLEVLDFLKEKLNAYKQNLGLLKN